MSYKMEEIISLLYLLSIPFTFVKIACKINLEFVCVIISNQKEEHNDGAEQPSNI